MKVEVSPKGDTEWAMVEAMLRNTHGPTHRQYSLELQHVGDGRGRGHGDDCYGHGVGGGGGGEGDGRGHGGGDGGDGVFQLFYVWRLEPIQPSPTGCRYLKSIARGVKPRRWGRG